MYVYVHMHTFSALEIPKIFLIAGAHLRVSISSVWDEVTKVFIILYVQYTHLGLRSRVSHATVDIHRSMYVCVL